MRDIFETQSASPMLIGEESEPFDDKNYIFELKLDGERCLAYIDTKGVELRNKRANRLLIKFPELTSLCKQVKKRCILDGELTVFVDGKPSFSALLSRIMMTRKGLKSELASEKNPACFTAFDILYYEDKDVTGLPLEQRKKLLFKTVRENKYIAISRFIESRGCDFYELAKAHQLEGIVAKRKDSLYYMGKRTTDWIKIKYMQDDDFVICGYIPLDHSMNAVVLAQYDKEKKLVYKGHVMMNSSSTDFLKLKKQRQTQCPFEALPKGNNDVIWIEPNKVCTVKFMHKTKSGGIRQPVFKCIRHDKAPYECRI